MKNIIKLPNNLINETSPYLIQHAYNPVNWYPWKKEVFEKAKLEDKPIFLSIGYSTCHWCHVMERESFEDNEVATLLNNSFICIKVDKEERPDVDSIYMTACQTFTGSGGWPLTAIITYDQKPFFVGTYFPKKTQYGITGLMDLLENIAYQWKTNRSSLLKSSEEATKILLNYENKEIKDSQSTNLSTNAINKLKRIFDNEYGGFGSAPKFPTPHNLLFLLKHYEITNDNEALIIIEKTLIQMYKGGIFDHIGFGFSRYSTDRIWLVPHFEKMLYDNALLTIAYLEIYDITKKEIYKSIAEKTMKYILRELTNSSGGFYCAEDADSDGIEGKYYVFKPMEIIDILGQENGTYFNQYFDITEKGNFEGQNIPNLINKSYFDEKIEELLPRVLEYRKNRTTLHKDDKILTSWNSLMIIAFVKASKILKNDFYLEKALKANQFIINHLSNENKLYTSTRNEKHSQDGYLDDYTFYISAQLELYQATLEQNFLDKANALTNILINDFYDHLNGGFYLYSNDSERLILRPKETYDGAIPSGNSFMTYNLIQLTRFFENVKLDSILKKQIDFMTQRTSSYPLGNSFYLLCELIIKQDFKKITCVLKNKSDLKNILFPKNSYIIILETPTQEYPLKNNKTTFYVCEKINVYIPQII